MKIDLNRVWELQTKHDKLLESMDYLRGSIKLFRNNGQAKAKELTSMTEALVIQRTANEKKIVELEKELVSAKDSLATEIIHRVEDGKLQQLMLLRYVECHLWDEICDVMKIPRRTLNRLHKAGLIALESSE